MLLVIAGYANGLSTRLIALYADTIFQCEYSYTTGSAYIQVEFILTNGTDYTAASSCISNLTLNIAQRIDKSAPVYISTLTLPSLTNDYNNSRFICSLWFSDVIQWRNATILIIPTATPSVLLQPTPVSMNTSHLFMSTCPSLCKGLVGGLLSGGALIGAICIIVVCILVRTKCQHRPAVGTVSFQNDSYKSCDSMQKQKHIGSKSVLEAMSISAGA